MDAKNLFKFDLVNSNCAFIKEFCTKNDCESNNNLIENCDRLLESLKFIDEKVYDLNFEQLPINGYLIFVNVVSSFIDRIVKNIEIKNQIDGDFIKLFKVIFNYRDWLFDTHQLLAKETDQNLMIQKSTVSSESFYNAIHANRDVLHLVFGEFFAFWLSSDNQKILKFFLKVMALNYRPPFSWSSFWNLKTMGKYCKKAFLNVDLDYCFDVWHGSENFFFSNIIVNSINRKIPVKSVTLNIKRQKRFRLDLNGKILDFDQMTKDEIDQYMNDEMEQDRQRSPGKRWRNKDDKIKCRFTFIKNRESILKSLDKIKERKINGSKASKLLKHHSADRKSSDQNESKKNEKDDEFKKTDASQKIDPTPKDSKVNDDDLNSERAILLYNHGGGWFTQGSTSCEIYLRRFCNSLGGIPILAVDYSLTVPYPIPNQEILDIYLWIFSGQDDVKEKLGFHPKKVVVSGDSAGGFFSLSLAITINELNKFLKKSDHDLTDNNNQIKKQYPLPSSIVLLYPVFSLVNMSPSRALFTIEPLVEFHLTLLMMSMYGGNVWSIGDFKKIKNSERFKKIEEQNRNLPISKKVFQSDLKNVNDSSPWFECDYSTYRNYSDYILSFYNHPFIVPSFYADKFEELKDISLFVAVGDQDVLLDDSIELTRKWRGKVRLDVFEDCIHGFPHYRHLIDKSKEAFDLVIERYQEAFNLL